MKKLITLLCIIAILAPFTPYQKTEASSKSISVKSDNAAIGSIPAPENVNNILMFPLAELFKLLGYETQVSDNKGNAEVAVHYDNSIYIATAGSKSSSVYDSAGTTLYRTVSMSQPAIQNSKQTVSVPLSYIREKIGLDITWKEQYNTLVVNNAGSKHKLIHNADAFHAAYLKINNTQMTLSNYEANMEMGIDSSGNTYPIVQNGTTLVPVSTLIKELGGSSSWKATEKKVTLSLNGNTIDIKIGSTTAIVNGSVVKLATPAQTINGRTMLPLRFVSENLGLEVYWDKDRSIIILYRAWFKDELEWNPSEYFYWFSSLNDPVRQKEIADEIADEQRAKEEAERQAQQKAADDAKRRGNNPYDADFNLVHIGDIVSVGFFDGQVLDINGSKLLVYWDSKSPFIPKGDEEFWAMIAGIRYGSSTWIEAKEVTISSSGY